MFIISGTKYYYEQILPNMQVVFVSVHIDSYDYVLFSCGAGTPILFWFTGAQVI